MRRTALTLLFLTFALGGATADAVTPPLVQAKMAACETESSEATPGRSATFLGSVRAVTGTARMSMRFEVQIRPDGAEDFVSVKSTALNHWSTSAAGVKVYRYRKQVTNLLAPAEYRALVRFRWLDANGKIVRSAKATTQVCKQVDARPNLVAGLLTWDAMSRPDQLRYNLEVRNDGPADAGSFDVSLTVDGVLQPATSLAGLASKTTQVVSFVAPRCARGTILRVRVDAADRVAESDETDNERLVACPV